MKLLLFFCLSLSMQVTQDLRKEVQIIQNWRPMYNHPWIILLQFVVQQSLPFHNLPTPRSLQDFS